MKHRICPHCNEPIVLVPSAAARAKKFGETAEYYRNLFTVCSDCQIKRWYGRETPVSEKGKP